MSPVRSARPLFINPSGDCPLLPSPSELAYSDLAERLRTSPARSSTEPELTPSGPGETRGRYPLPAALEEENGRRVVT